jgi:hypothetical protein
MLSLLIAQPDERAEHAAFFRTLVVALQREHGYQVSVVASQLDVTLSRLAEFHTYLACETSAEYLPAQPFLIRWRDLPSAPAEIEFLPTPARLAPSAQCLMLLYQAGLLTPAAVAQTEGEASQPTSLHRFNRKGCYADHALQG